MTKARFRSSKAQSIASRWMRRVHDIIAFDDPLAPGAFPNPPDCTVSPSHDEAEWWDAYRWDSLVGYVDAAISTVLLERGRRDVNLHDDADRNLSQIAALCAYCVTDRELAARSLDGLLAACGMGFGGYVMSVLSHAPAVREAAKAQRKGLNAARRSHEEQAKKKAGLTAAIAKAMRDEHAKHPAASMTDIATRRIPQRTDISWPKGACYTPRQIVTISKKAGVAWGRAAAKRPAK